MRSLNGRTALALFGALLLLGFSYYLNRKMPAVQVADTTTEAALPRYTVYGAHMTRFGLDGLPALVGTADSIDYFDDHSAKLVMPVMTLLSNRETKTPWILRAPTGHVPPYQHRIYLDNPVVANGSWPDGVPVTALTTWAWIDSDLHEFFTDAKVTLIGDLRHGTAVGMLGNWQDPATLHLLHDVKMTYVSVPKPSRRR